MRRIAATEMLTLDGVMQAPGRADEDPRGGFDRGGWAVPFNDQVMGEEMGKGMASAGALLFGRRTYEDMAGFWPSQTDNPFTEMLDNVQKYVVSRTLGDPLPWKNSTLLSDDGIRAVTELKASPGPDLAVLGSGQLVQSLMRHRLIDEYVLLIHPLVLGQGFRLFVDDNTESSLTLVSSVTTTTGVIIARYQHDPA
jgi:dihydrofolate reductase